MALSDSKNLLTGSQADRISVTPLGEQLFRDETSGAVFVGDGSTVGGHSISTRPVVTKTTSYTATRTDEGRLVVFNASVAKLFTIPTHASIAYPIGLTELVMFNKGSANVTITSSVSANGLASE